MATSHEVTFIPDDLLFIHSDIQVMPPTFVVESDRYIVMEAYQPMAMIETELDAIKDFVEDMQHRYDLEVVFLPLNIVKGGTGQGRFLKERIPEMISIDYSVKSYLLMQDAVLILGQTQMVITSHYHALVLAAAK
ncbi:hypothetical protein [Aerococcus urinaeequi]|uniref:Uncharacterized protein n=1 Tax=Aerococcus urinaeequi TaxID=51665 RepID=A0AAC9A703_9LACT|nr:hypothetical protein [Aerococcus urinaeequi]AMB97010.1 hypothetical protein AWM74_01615 [Aerococcus urinaeequi]